MDSKNVKRVDIAQSLHNWEAFRASVAECVATVGNHDVRGLNGSSIAYFICELCTHLKDGQPLIVVTAGEKEASELVCDLHTASAAISVALIPWWATIPYRSAATQSPVFGERSSSLLRLAACADISGLGVNSDLPHSAMMPCVFVITERAFMSPLASAAGITCRAVTFVPSQQVDTAVAAGQLVSLGYTRVPRVHVRGEFSLRGEVIDIFLYGEDYPIRIKLDYDKIVSIKYFDTETQTTTIALPSVTCAPTREVHWNAENLSKLKSAIKEYNDTSNEQMNTSHLLAASSPHLPFTDKAASHLEEMMLELEINGASEGEELLYPLAFGRGTTIADYAGKDALLFLVSRDRLANNEAAIYQENNAMYRKARQDFPCLPPDEAIIPLNEVIAKFPHSVSLRNLGEEGGIALNTNPSRSFFGNIAFLKETLLSLRVDGWRTVVFAGGENQAVRINAILKDEDSGASLATVSPDSITEGFSVPDIKLLVIQEGEIFARKRRAASLSRKARSEAIDTFVELNPGDYVVHVDYGIGIFRSIDRVVAGGHERDYIKVEYADGDTVFVPTECVNMVQRYIGSDSPHLDRIGSKAWEKRKARTSSAVEEMAHKLLELYARRKASRGYPFPPDGEWQAAFEAAFPYEDTPDQTTVTEEIKRDMEKSVPMDRLICGDVGYGKTEVAMRAAFKAVMGGKQVAFLAPTTLLAEQHYDTCIERFEGFPVKIACLSRFVPPAEQRKILAALAEGNVDILIGTHRIIQKDVLFKSLGLLIVDEEQRFGVKDKEKLKTMRANIDCLAMSATPIPRTLHMSLLKIRDMSLLTTPPQNRQAVETAVEPYSDDRVARAIRDEVDRGGQVFYLHNRIESLNETRSRIEHLVPEMMVECAHGAMSADDLDDIFRRFKAGAFHVLISTTIIENGIDIPNVNTIIIDRADMYGISQLYQLRGRVGRSDRKAYAYLLYPGQKVLSEVAMKRLEAISDFTELGSGFKIAMKDMEIRGAGNLLGRDQSGEICAVGFDMYMRLLSQAVDRLKRDKDIKDAGDTLIEINYTGFIPDTYIENTQVKMEVYKDIARAASAAEIAALTQSLTDRFGDVPDSVVALLSLAEVKAASASLGIRSIREKNSGEKAVLVIEAEKTSHIKIDRLLTLIKENPSTISLSPTESNKIFIKCGALNSEQKIQYLREVLMRLS